MSDKYIGLNFCATNYYRSKLYSRGPYENNKTYQKMFLMLK